MDQIEMMLLQMEDLNGIPLVDFTPNDTNNNTSFENLLVSSPTFMNFHPSNQNPSAAHSFHQQPNGFPGPEGSAAQKGNSMAAMREMIFRIAAMQPIHIDPDSVKPPKRRNVKISSDPQSVAARHRREKISERIRILQRLVPGGTKMDTASMLDEAIHYVKFLKNQVRSLERVAANRPSAAEGIGFPVPMSSGNYFPLQAGKGYHHYQSSPQHLGDS